MPNWSGDASPSPFRQEADPYALHPSLPEPGQTHSLAKPCFWVESGTAFVFIKLHYEGQIYFRYLLTVTKQQFLFPFAGDAHAELFFKGSQHSVIRCLPPEALTTDDDDQSRVQASIRYWIQEIGKELATPPPLDPSWMLISDITSRPITNTTLVGSGMGPIWVQASVDTQYLSEHPVPAHQWTPLTTQTWIQATTDGKLEVRPPEQAVPLSDLDAYLRILGQLHYRQLISTFSTVLAESESEQRATRQHYEHHIEDLMDLVGHRPDTPPNEPAHVDSALAQVCRHFGVPYHNGEPSSHEDLPLLNTLKWRAKQLRLRYRTIRLTQGWTQSVTYPVLTIAQDTQTVAVFLPSADRYMLKGSKTTRWQAYGLQIIGPEVSPPETGIIRKTSAFLGQNRKDLYVIAAATALIALLSVCMPLAVQILFDRVIPDQDMVNLVLIFCFLFIITGVTFMLELARRVALFRLDLRDVLRWTHRVWSRILSLPPVFFKQHSSSVVIQRFLSILQMRQVITVPTVVTILDSFTIVILSLVLLFYHWPLALLIYLFLGAMAICTGLAAWLMAGHFRQILPTMATVLNRQTLLITGIAKIRINGATMRALNHWIVPFKAQQRLSLKVETIGTVFSTLITGLKFVGYILVFSVMASESRSALPLGALLAILTLFGMVMAIVEQLLGTVFPLTKVFALAERLKPFYDTEPEVTPHKKDPGLLHGHIELQDLTFRYEDNGPLILNKLSLKIRKGEFVAITGNSGCGKSTVLRILLGFEIPQSGSVFFDNMDLSELDTAAVRHQIGVVLQNDALLSGDIYTNICGATKLSMEAAWEAAERAGIADEIRDMPMQMSTLVSNGGTLSAGQKQRILIARVLAARPRLVFLDEATSALDNTTQDKIAGVFEKLNMTRIVIAHRLSTIEKADRIYVIRDGKIAETGTHAKLIRNRDYFYQLVQRQSLHD